MSSKKICFNKEYAYIGGTLLIVFALFWFLFPIYAYDSAWYLTYVEYFNGNAPLSNWNNIRGFTFPFILWVAHIIKAGPWGIEIVLCFFYMVYGLYIFKIVRLIKKHTLDKTINLFDCFSVFLFAMMSSILWGYFHYVLTECIGVSLLAVYLYYAIKFFIDRKNNNVAKKKYTAFLALTCVMTILLWFLKQSFIANTIFLAAIFELLAWIDKFTFKKAIFSITLAISVVVSLRCSIIAWNRVIDTETDYTKFMLNRLNHMRYIVPEDIYYGGAISVMNDDWEVIDRFNYSYEVTYLSGIKYWCKCLRLLA